MPSCLVAKQEASDIEAVDVEAVGGVAHPRAQLQMAKGIKHVIFSLTLFVVDNYAVCS